MVLEIVSIVSRNLVPFGLIIALILFGRLAIRAMTLRSLQAALSVFLIIWIVAEIPRSLIQLSLITVDPGLQFLGLVVHTVSMVAFGFLIVWRFYRISTGKGGRSWKKQVLSLL